MSFNSGFSNASGKRVNYLTSGNYLGNSCCKCRTNNCCSLQIRKPPNTPVPVPKPIPQPPYPPIPPMIFSPISGGEYTTNGKNNDDYPAVVLSFTKEEWVPVQVTLPYDPLPMISDNAFGTNAVSAINCVSTSSNGNGVGGGYYKYANDDRDFNIVAMVVSQTDGRWNQAISIKNPTLENSLKQASIIKSISASSNGNAVVCGITKSFTTNNVYSLCIANQINNIWDSSFTIIPNSNSTYSEFYQELTCVSASSQGNAFACGYRSVNNEFINCFPFVVLQKDGVWTNAEDIIYPDDFDPSGSVQRSQIFSVSYPEDYYGIAGGFYVDISGGEAPLLVPYIETTIQPTINIILPDDAATGINKSAKIYSVSSYSNETSIAGGYYNDTNSKLQAMIVLQIDGIWNQAEKIDLPGAAKDNDAAINVVAIYTDGLGAIAGGYYTDENDNQQAMLVNINIADKSFDVYEVFLPSDASLSNQMAAITSVSSYKSGYGFAMGYYNDPNGYQKSMYINQKGYTWQNVASPTPLPANFNNKNSFTTLKSGYNNYFTNL